MQPRMLAFVLSLSALACADHEDDERIRIDAPQPTFCFDERSEGFRDLSVVIAERSFAWRITSAGIASARFDEDGSLCEGAAIASPDQTTVDVTLRCPVGMHFPRVVLETTKGERFASVSVRATSDGECPLREAR